MNAERVNALANHPDVRPWLLGGTEALDLTPLVENPAVVVLEAEHGAFVLVPIMSDVYELHTLFEPQGRGKAVLAQAAEMFRYVFVHTPALEIVTKVPDGNSAAGVAAAHAGFTDRFKSRNTSHRGLTVQAWALKDSLTHLHGHTFHETLEQAKRASGCDLPVHPDDPTHDAIVGASLMMGFAGNLEKGVDLYNRWAIFAGYATIALVGPGLVDIRDAIVEVRDGRVGVLTCRSEQRLPPQVS